MPSFPTPPPIATALVAACEPILAMMEAEPRFAPEGERLVVALLGAADTMDFSALLLTRRLRGRLESSKRKAALAALQGATNAPRHA